MKAICQYFSVVLFTLPPHSAAMLTFGGMKSFVFAQRPCSELLNKIGLPSLENQRLAKIVCTVFNAINNDHAPKSIKELIGLRNNKYNQRGSDILKRPKTSTTTYGLNSWRFAAPKLWNSLPDSSRTVQTYKAFKNSIRTLDLAGLL